MNMKIYTQAEFYAIPRDENGVRHCPTGDYTQVHYFDEYCFFGEHSVFGMCSYFGAHSSFGEFSVFGICSYFGAHSSFGKGSTFGRDSHFSKNSDFGVHSSFGEYSSFAMGCSFDKYCSFGKHCSFDKYCSFGEYSFFSMGCFFDKCCSFDKSCSFSECCIFGVNCSHEGLTNSRYFACYKIGSERRTTYFFAADEGLYVRTGCFFGTLNDFVKRVKEVHAGTRYEREYLAAVKLAKIVLKDDE